MHKTVLWSVYICRISRTKRGEVSRLVKAGRESLKLGRGCRGFESKEGPGQNRVWGGEEGKEGLSFFFFFLFHLLGQRIPHYVISFREEDGTKSICWDDRWRTGIPAVCKYSRTMYDIPYLCRYLCAAILDLATCVATWQPSWISIVTYIIIVITFCTCEWNEQATCPGHLIITYSDLSA